MTSQFHEFFDLIFGGILSFWPNCETESEVVAGFWIPVVVKIKLSKESRKRVDVAGLSDPGGQGDPSPYILADQLTLFKSRGDILCPPLYYLPPPQILDLPKAMQSWSMVV